MCDMCPDPGPERWDRQDLVEQIAMRRLTIERAYRGIAEDQAEIKQYLKLLRTYEDRHGN